jgi:hypothetical protein
MGQLLLLATQKTSSLEPSDVGGHPQIFESRISIVHVFCRGLYRNVLVAGNLKLEGTYVLAMEYSTMRKTLLG